MIFIPSEKSNPQFVFQIDVPNFDLYALLLNVMGLHYVLYVAVVIAEGLLLNVQWIAWINFWYVPFKHEQTQLLTKI